MRVRVEIDVVAEGLDGRDDPGYQLAAGCHLKIAGQ
jgi:hypothetical protein